jgi:hypothetical protein
MIDTKMPVEIFRGDKNIGAGELLPNGQEMALCPNDKNFRLLNMQTDTNAVEDRIPMTFLLEKITVAEGQLYYSGDYICLCPEVESDVELFDEGSSAKLFVDDNGRNARLEVSRKGH